MRMKSALSVLVPAALFLQANAAPAAVCGDAYYNHGIDWPNTPALYYTVTGAPANTCGDLWASRNGAAYVKGAGWICTDSSGSATKGPWSSNPIDETAYVYIDWGSCTSPVRQHIWDVTEATVNVTSSVPGAFSGTATDATWGAGFNAGWTQCQASYKFDTGTGIRYWNPLTGGYTSSYSIFVPCSISGMPSMNITWSTSSTQRPPLAIHISGGYYTWTAWIYDGGQWVARSVSFTF
jgi:hypothetical protein